MNDVAVFTSANFAYLDRVRVLGETLHRHHPDWPLWLCICDIEPIDFKIDLNSEPFDHIVRVEQLDIPDMTRWIFDHDVVELCTAVKGAMLCRLLEMGIRKVIYLDPDIAVFNSLSAIEQLLDDCSVVLTPHQLEPDDNYQAIADNEIGSLKHGIYNLGFLAVANSPEGWRFAKWWRDRLTSFCFDDIPNGLFTDQRWCDHAPVFFPNMHILRDPGFNVASWNQSRRPISIGPDGSALAAGHLLRFFHFTKVNLVGELMLERYAAGNLAVFELMKWYRARLKVNTPKHLPSSWWAYGQYTDGSTILREHRLTYRARHELRTRFPDPFLAGSGSLPEYFKQAT
jgi:hypothetical protein